ncbi:MAG: DUF1573 domain-containing protein [Rikenellaceae bacterium]|nr:DUF1573 domain-containing protein [Rikenellaceae bacterium]
MLRRLLPAALLLCCGCGRQADRPAKPYSGTVVELTAERFGTMGGDTLDLGRMRSGEVIEKSLRLRNATGGPLTVLAVESSCGCTTVDYDRGAADEGDSIRFGFRFDSRGMQGWQLKELRVKTDADPRPFRLLIACVVE